MTRPLAGRAATEGALRHLAAALAHEIRNPLNAMAIHAELLEARVRRLPEADSATGLRSIEVLRQEIDRIDGILERYLRHAGPEEAERVAVEVAALVGGAIDRARPSAELRGVRIEPRLEPGMRWSLDAPAIGQALDQLLENAIGASRDGGVVIVRARVADDNAVIEVSDQGDEIAAEARPLLFQLGGGTSGDAGIGLAVAKQIIRGHGGAISAHSDDGRGTTLRIELPPE